VNTIELIVGQTLAHHYDHLIWKSMCTPKQSSNVNFGRRISGVNDKKSLPQAQSHDIVHNNDQRTSKACKAVFNVNLTSQAFGKTV
jgi:hypothetical protein